MSERLEIRTLGGLNIRRDGRPLTGLASRKVEALLAYLACAGRPRPRELLAELLWEERTQERAMGNLRVALSSLRKRVGPYVAISREEVGINPEADVWLDIQVLERALSVARGSAGSLSESLVARMAEALNLHQGDFLAGFFLRGSSGFENWALLERERIRAAYEQGLQLLLDGLLAGQRWGEAVTWGERWIAGGQTPEPAYRAVMRANAGLGDLAGMTAAYQRCVSALDEELAIGPSDQTTDLYEYLSGGGQPWIGDRSPAAVHEAPGAGATVAALLARSQRGGSQVLDVTSLAVIYAGADDLVLGPDEADLLVRSVLHHGVDVEPWLARVGTPQVAVQALNASLARHPIVRVREQIVDALASLPGAQAAEALARVATTDDAPGVRSEAALGAASKGRVADVVRGLLEDIQAGGEAVALPALVAVADEYGLPEGLGPFPRGPLALGLARRRWQIYRHAVVRQVLRAGVGGALAMAFTAVAAFLPALFLSPETIASTTEVVSIGVWVFSNALLGLFLGALQGGATGLIVGMGDALWPRTVRGKQRFALAALAGLVQSMFQVFLSLSGSLEAAAPVAVYVPVFVAYGLWFGAALSLTVPSLREQPPARRRQVIRAGLAALLICLITIPTVYIVHGSGSAIVLYLMNAIFLPLGVALALGGPTGVGRRAAAV